MFSWELNHIRTLTHLPLANWEMTKQMKKKNSRDLKVGLKRVTAFSSYTKTWNTKLDL